MIKKLFCLFCFFIIANSYAQETTGVLRGTIDNDQNNPIGLAAITVTQNSTGTKYTAISQENGFFAFNQLQPDSNYSLEVYFNGFETYKQENIVIRLGKIINLKINLAPKTEELKTVEIVIQKGARNSNDKRIRIDQIINLPTLNRSIQDATRLLPEANLNSFGGANYRFNNLSIDGSATNDVLGFQEPASGAAGSVASGTPGGLAGTQPIGFGAISALSVKTAPFDVTFGNFTGASINLVTKNGTNTTNGSVYVFLRNRSLTGNYSDGIKQQSAAFYDKVAGASIGGPIVKNKLFYYFNAEFSDRSEPVLNAPGSANSNISKETVNLIANRLKTKYNYDPGISEGATLERKNTKLFLRLDYNISDKHKLTLRNNFVTGFADNLEWSQNIFNFGNQGFRHNSTTNSIVAELKSRFTNNLSNKLTISHTTVKDDRTFKGKVFPHIEIINNTSNTIFAGTYREAAVYGLTLNTSQFTDNLTWYKNNHTFTLGTSTEFNDIQYRFLTAFNGRWQYSSVNNFLMDKPNRVRGVYNIEGNDFEYNKKTPSADYQVVLSSVYLQDEIKVNDKLSLLAGIRIDGQFSGNFPVSSQIQSTPEFAKYKNKINNSPVINPRVGFTYNFDEDEKYVLKGGSGLFTGRMPFVWYAYSHYISGTKYFNIDFRPTTPLDLTSDLSSLEAKQGKRLTEINLVDNNFSLPRDWKSNLNFDIKLKHNFGIQLEATYTQVLKGLLFQSINRKEDLKANFTGADNRPYYTTSGDAAKINTNFTNVFLLTNTNQGYRYNLTVSLTKSAPHYNGFVGYTYGESKDISSTVRNSHAANFEFNQALVANSPKLAYSNFDLRHKIISYHFYDLAFKKASLRFGLIYNGRSGSPFSFVYEGDINRDGSAKNDILYIPRNQSEIKLQDIVGPNNTVLATAGQQWAQLDSYINNNEFLSDRRGQYADRNAARTPWNHQVDAKIVFQQKIAKKNLEFSLDIFNFGNLINKNIGAQHYVPNINNSGYALLDFVKIENGNPVFQFKNPQSKPYLVDTINSRWQAQFGITYLF